MHDRGKDIGFFDAEVARQHVLEQRKRAEARHAPAPKVTWRDVERICIPGWLISRAIRAIEAPLVLAGPEAIKRLEPYAERLCDIPCPSLWQRTVRAVVLWLLEAPDDVPEATEEAPPPAPAWLTDALEASAPPRETQTHGSADQQGEEGCLTSSDQGNPEGSRARRRCKAQGVR